MDFKVETETSAVSHRISLLKYSVFFIMTWFFLTSLPALADETPMPDDTFVQAMFGLSVLEKDDTDLDNSTDTLSSDISTFPVLGIMGQIPLAFGSTVMAGFEGGGELSWLRDEAKLISNGGVTTVYLKNKMIMGNLLMGGFISTNPNNSVRAYAGAGATMNWSRIEIDSDNIDSGDPLYVSETQSAFGYGAYVRCGIDFMISDGGLVGVCAKYTSAKIDYESSFTREDFNGFQVMMTYTAPVSSLGI